MNRILDDGLVALALVASAAYALSSLGPKALRKQLWGTLARLAERAPSMLHLRGVARRLNAAADKASACGGCDNCGSQSPDTDRKAATEVRVPLSELGKRR